MVWNLSSYLFWALHKGRVIKCSRRKMELLNLFYPRLKQSLAEAQWVLSLLIYLEIFSSKGCQIPFVVGPSLRVAKSLCFLHQKMRCVGGSKLFSLWKRICGQDQIVVEEKSENFRCCGGAEKTAKNWQPWRKMKFKQNISCQSYALNQRILRISVTRAKKHPLTSLLSSRQYKTLVYQTTLLFPHNFASLI